MPVRYSDQSSGPSTRRAKEDQPEEPIGDYSEYTKAELQEVAEALGLPTSGTKAVLIARLSG